MVGLGTEVIMARCWLTLGDQAGICPRETFAKQGAEGTGGATLENPHSVAIAPPIANSSLDRVVPLRAYVRMYIPKTK